MTRTALNRHAEAGRSQAALQATFDRAFKRSATGREDLFQRGTAHGLTKRSLRRRDDGVVEAGDTE